MISQLQEFVVDKAQALNDQVTRIRQGSVKSARVAVQGTAESLKGLKNPVRLVARSGVRLSPASSAAATPVRTKRPTRRRTPTSATWSRTS